VSLYTLLTTGKDGLNHSTYGPQGSVYIYKHLDMIQLVINNFDNGTHPFHLHGHQFQIVARGKNGPYNETGTNDVDWHFKNPSRRDTVVVPGGGFVIIRYRADNPGVWFFHCHISWHLSTGLAAAMIEAPEIVQQTQSISNHSMDQCSFNGLSFSGNAAGKQGSDLYGAPRGIYLEGSLSPSS
jgi:iron transport multicopper oxidase